MNILVYCGHPAQYYFFKNALIILRKRGHSIKLLIKSKDILEELVKNDGWEYENIQEKVRSNSKVGILKGALQRTLSVVKIAKSFKADILAGTDSSIAQAAWWLGKTSFTTLEDDIEIIANLAKLTYPFTSHIVVPKVCRVGKYERKKIGYDGFMKLAYLHPKYFTKDSSILKKYELNKDFVLIRIAKLSAHHDVGIKGLNHNLVNRIIEIANKKGMRTYISSEEKLDGQLSQFLLHIDPTDMHQIMAHAQLLVSDSQSMSVEAAMLGIPSLRFNDFVGRISVLEELEKTYGLTYGIKTMEPDKLLYSAERILSDPDSLNKFQDKRKRLLEDKVDVTEFIVNLFENYQSLKRRQ